MTVLSWSAPGSILIASTWWHNEWVVYVTDDDGPDEPGPTAKAIESGAVGIDESVEYMHERALCGSHLGISIWLPHLASGVFVHSSDWYVGWG